MLSLQSLDCAKKVDVAFNYEYDLRKSEKEEIISCTNVSVNINASGTLCSAQSKVKNHHLSIK
jgi:hypothetical protein